MPRKKTLDEVRELLGTYQCVLLTTTYRGSLDPLLFRCSCTRMGSYTLAYMGDQIKRTGRICCRECAYERKADNKHPSFDVVKAEFEKRNFTLLETYYTSAQTPMRCQCSCGKKTTKRYWALLHGAQCHECGQKKRIATVRETYPFDVVKAEFEKRNFKLLETSYKSANTALRCICPCGRRTTKTIRSLLAGRKCSECGYQNQAESNSKPFEEIIKEITDCGFKFVDAEYKKTTGKYHVICPCGEHDWKMLKSIRAGHTCRICYAERMAERQRVYTIEYVRSYFASQRCKLLTEEYENAIDRLKYICECGNESAIPFSAFLRGGRCRKCGTKKALETRRQREAAFENDSLVEQLERRLASKDKPTT